MSGPASSQTGRPSGHVYRVERKRGPVWYAKYRLPSGRQVQTKLRPARTERGRPPARSENDLSQRALAQLLGVSQPRVVELESGERNPQHETLVKISAATRLEFAIDIAPVGQAPKLVGKAVTRRRAHVYAGASVLVASS